MWFRLAILAALAGLLSAGCDGEGLFIKSAGIPIDGGDQDGGNGDEEPPAPIPGDQQNLGTWIAAYGDDWIDPTALNGVVQYAASVSLLRDGSVLSGTGTVFRVFREGLTPYDKLRITLSGTITGDNATATVDSATGGRVGDSPTWRLRFAGRRMVGMYVSRSTSGAVVRAGHTLWHRISNADLNGTWVAGLDDAYGARSWPARSRTGLLVLTHDTNANTLAGQGNFVEQRPADAPATVEFNVVRAEVARPQALFSLGELSLTDNEMDWFAFFTSDAAVGAYAQFDASDRLVRYGTATWYESVNVTPEAVSRAWVSAFSDAETREDLVPADFLCTLTLQAGAENAVTGSGRILESVSINGALQSVVVDEASIVGTHVILELRVPATGDRFSWDLRLASSAMAGSYQRTDGFGRFVSRGSAVWRRETAQPSLTGAWVSAYYDSVHADGNELTQMALVSVTSQNDAGLLTGQGSLRYGNGEQGRRLFDLRNASVSNRDILWVWRGADLFGDTVWRLRQAGEFLCGIYENRNSAGNFESRGAATWIRTSQSASF